MANISHGSRFDGRRVAEGLGFEPRYSGSKPDVLPLDDPSPVNSSRPALCSPIGRRDAAPFTVKFLRAIVPHPNKQTYDENDSDDLHDASTL